MIWVDSSRCAYCGCCVSVCPVDALTLREKRLVVSDACIDCNLSLPACPLGALGGSEDRKRELSSVPHACDVVVVGAGPAGSVAARVAPRRWRGAMCPSNASVAVKHYGRRTSDVA